MPENHDVSDGDESNGKDASEHEIQETGLAEMSHADAKEDMFVDAPEELNFDTPVKETMTVADGVNGRVDGEYEEERGAFAREFAELKEQLKALIDGNGSTDESQDGSTEVGSSLNETVSRISKFLEGVKEERVQHEKTVRELRELIYQKDHEIEDLNAKVSDVSVSRDTETGSRVQLETNQQVEVVADRIIASLSTVFSQEELQDNSLTGKVTYVENCISSLIANYNHFWYGIDQLRNCLSTSGTDLSMHEFGSVLGNACSELLELKKSGAEIVEKLNHLEDENRKLVEKVDKDRETMEAVNAELGKTKVELEQEKNRCANTKEKLSIAVTKGKALVQQRDALKQSLAEKGNELEKCLNELQVKSNALEALESSRGLLELSLAEKINEMDKCLKESQDKSRALEELEQSLAEKTKELEETLSKRDTVLEKFEAILSQIDVPDEVQSMDIMERLGWFAEERNELRGVSLEINRLKDIMFSVDLPEEVSDSNLESRLAWLKESFFQAKNELSLLQYQIERLSSSLSTELQEKDNIQKELNDVSSRFKEMEETVHQVSLEKDQILTRLLETSGLTTEEGVHQMSSDMAMIIDRCFRKITEETSKRVDTSYADPELFEKIQSLLYVKDQDLSLYEEILGEETMVRLQVAELSNELRVASKELAALKEEKNVLQKDLERAEDKTALLREKLSMAVKKGKGLVQDRENLKLQLDEKNTEIEKLKLELQQQENTVGECKDQINILSADLEHIRKLEAELISVKDQRDQLEQTLSQSNSMLQRVIESIDRIMLHVDSVSEDPLDKVNWLAGYFKECQLAKVRAQEDLEKVQEEACGLASKLEEANAALRSVEDSLSISENNIERLSEEKRQAEVAKENIEQELQKMVEDASSLTSKFNEACATKKFLEDALLQAEKNISELTSERKGVRDSTAAVEMELEKVREEVASQTSKLVEAHNTIDSLENALSKAERDITLLTEQNKDAEAARTKFENELKKLKDEIGSQASQKADADARIKSLEDALVKAENSLSQAESNLTLLTRQNNVVEVTRTNLENELVKLKDEIESQAKQKADADTRIKSLENALRKAENSLAQAESYVTLLTSQNNDAEVARATLENELKKLKDEIESQARTKTDAEGRIKSLEDALLEAENSLSALQREKVNAEVEISTLNSKLNACVEELTGLSGSSETRSSEIIGHLDNFQVLLKDDALFSKLNQLLARKFESLKGMELIVGDIRSKFEKGLATQKSDNATEDVSFVSKPFLNGFDASLKVEMRNMQANTADGDYILSCFAKITEGFKMRDKILFDSFESFSTSMDVLVEALLKKLTATRVDVVNMLEHTESLKENVNNLEASNQEHEKAISMLEKDVSTLLSACGEAVKELQFEVKNDLLELSHIPEIQFQEEQSVGQSLSTEHPQRLDDSKYIQRVEELSSASRKARTVIKSFGKTSNAAAAIIQSLQNKLEEVAINLEKAEEERDLNQNRVLSLEADVESLEASCRELKLQMEDFQAKEGKWREKEAELSSLCNNMLVKEAEKEDPLLSASDIRALFDKINGIDMPFMEPVMGLEQYDVKMLFHIIDSVTEMHHQIDLLSHEKEELKSALSTKVLEVEHLKEEVETHSRNMQDQDKTKTELSELRFGLEKVLGMLGCGDSLIDSKTTGSWTLLQTLDKQVTALILEAEASKSKAQELGVKLLGSQKLVDELSSKVKVLEDSRQDRTIQPEIVQERSIFEAPKAPSTSEISEIEDVGSLGKSLTSPSPSAAQVRTIRKGSAEHLAISIDSESDRLINRDETDEDKGHVFKSLNMSGLIPKQGKMIADRIDGVWVAGGRNLMSRPRARLGVIAYCLFLHLWLLGSIL